MQWFNFSESVILWGHQPFLCQITDGSIWLKSREQVLAITPANSSVIFKIWFFTPSEPFFFRGVYCSFPFFSYLMLLCSCVLLSNYTWLINNFHRNSTRAKVVYFLISTGGSLAYICSVVYLVMLLSMNIGNSGGLNVNTRNEINIISMTITDIIVAHLLGSEYLRKWDETQSAIK